jgi:hypothetical protein
MFYPVALLAYMAIHCVPLWKPMDHVGHRSAFSGVLAKAHLAVAAVENTAVSLLPH